MLTNGLLVTDKVQCKLHTYELDSRTRRVLGYSQLHWWFLHQRPVDSYIVVLRVQLLLMARVRYMNDL